MKAVTLTLALAAMAPSSAQDTSVKQDLFAVITLKGHACNEVLSVETLGENDYVAQCKTGDRYRVYLGANEHVIVEKQ